MNNRTSPRSNAPGSRPHRWAGSAALGSLAFVALVAVLLPASAMGASATVTHTIRITAPYPGTIVSPSTSLSLSGCGSGGVPTVPNFHPSTGMGGLAGNTMMNHCISAVGGSSAASEELSVGVPISVLTGHDRIVEKWNVRAGGGIHLALGTCVMPTQTNTSGFSECDVYAESVLNGYSYLVDATNGSYIAYATTSWTGLGTYASLYEYCDLGSCSTYSNGMSGTFGFSGTVGWTFVASGLLATHTYVLDTYWYASEEVYQSAYSAALLHCHGDAWLNAGNSGNGIDLSSITVT